ncbi:MAG: Do family serine endopeptidase [Dysgonamonadaceae bacterium]|jgi:Do/DeqQ family serine protease|nr:Do family serine endopeptidase [Dysgonamonadaceae bacterium]
MKNFKFLGTLVLVAAISSGISLGTYTLLNNRQQGAVNSHEFDQGLTKLTTLTGEAAENTDFTIVAENTVHGVVHIKSSSTPVTAPQRAGEDREQGSQPFDLFEYFFGPDQGQGQRQQPRAGTPNPQPRVGFGSGVIISTDGYIITNNHVIDGADEITVTLNDNSTFAAKLIGTDPATDIALIKIEATGLTVIPFGDSDRLKVGEWVLAVGNPFNLTSTVTAGIVSAKGRGNVFPRAKGDNPMRVESFIQTDAAVNPGNSGGALVNTRGELVGINTAIFSETGNFAGYSFAVPSSIAAKVAADLKKYGTVQRAMLGVSIQDIGVLKSTNPEVAAKLKVTEGAYVADMGENSAAKAAGIEVGDVIIAVNGTKVRTVSALQEAISLQSPGSKVKVTVMRGSAEKEFTVELKNDQGTTEVVKNVSGTELLGGAFQELSAEKKKELNISNGIEITGLTDGKLKDAGIRKGFVITTVNDRQISSVDGFKRLVDQVLKQSSGDKALFIKGVYPNGKVEFYAINLNK